MQLMMPRVLKNLIYMLVIVISVLLYEIEWHLVSPSSWMESYRMSFLFELDPKSEFVSDGVEKFRHEIRKSYVEACEKDPELSQAKIAEELGVNRSVINRRINDGANLTLRSILELLWAMDRDYVFETFERKDDVTHGDNCPPRVNVASANSEIKTQNMSFKLS
ncbi:hypothetical protein UF64_10990 [Thalassospira sp. HJ]|nr:hypothetical protein UF64_10990 [Thalassospira sp. HJ]